MEIVGDFVIGRFKYNPAKLLGQPGVYRDALELEGKTLRRFNQQIGPLRVLLRRTVNTHNSKLHRPRFNYQILFGVRWAETMPQSFFARVNACA